MPLLAHSEISKKGVRVFSCLQTCWSVQQTYSHGELNTKKREESVSKPYLDLGKTLSTDQCGSEQGVGTFAPAKPKAHHQTPGVLAELPIAQLLAKRKLAQMDLGAQCLCTTVTHFQVPMQNIFQP
jgi:hypothetical protein